MKKTEVTIMKHELTAEQFLNEVKAELKLAGLEVLHSDLDINYFAAGMDIEFDVHHSDDDFSCRHEVSISKPYEAETYLTNFDGTEYNEYIRFVETDSKTHTGTGIYFLRNVQ